MGVKSIGFDPWRPMLRIPQPLRIRTGEELLSVKGWSFQMKWRKEFLIINEFSNILQIICMKKNLLTLSRQKVLVWVTFVQNTPLYSFTLSIPKVACWFAGNTNRVNIPSCHNSWQQTNNCPNISTIDPIDKDMECMQISFIDVISSKLLNTS